MPRLISYNKEIRSIFELLGDKENDITLSISWALAKCPEFLKAVVSAVVPVMPDPEETVILNQQYTADTGITDIEVTDYKTFHVIFEAKRGWVLPGAEQLTKYSVRKDFAASGVANKVIVTLSECTETYEVEKWLLKLADRHKRIKKENAEKWTEEEYSEETFFEMFVDADETYGRIDPFETMFHEFMDNREELDYRAALELFR